MSQATTRRFLLPEEELPTHFYNIAADLPSPPPPPLHPGTGQPIGPADLAPLFPMELIKQEVSAERYIPIPEPIRDAYRIYRPSPLVRALGLAEGSEAEAIAVEADEAEPMEDAFAATAEADADAAAERRAILERLSRREIGADEAAAALRELSGS